MYDVTKVYVRHGIVSHHDEEVDGEEEVLDRAGHATLHLEGVFEKSVRSLNSRNKMNERSSYFSQRNIQLRTVEKTI